MLGDVDSLERNGLASFTEIYSLYIFNKRESQVQSITFEKNRWPLLGYPSDNLTFIY